MKASVLIISIATLCFSSISQAADDPETVWTVPHITETSPHATVTSMVPDPEPEPYIPGANHFGTVHWDPSKVNDLHNGFIEYYDGEHQTNYKNVLIVEEVDGVEYHVNTFVPCWSSLNPEMYGGCN